jgi:hypothetical protein
VTTLLLAALLAAPPGAHAAGDRDTWTVAKAAAAKYRVSATLVVAIRVHENPLRRNDYKACGVKDPTGRHKWYPGGLKGQVNKCADIVARYAKRHGWDPEHPTRAQVMALGKFYAEGSNHWGAQVWSLYRRMRP